MINSEHSEEFNIKTTRSGVAKLPLEALLLEEQDEDRLPKPILQTIDNLPAGPRVEPRQTMINLLSQLYSLRQLWSLVQLTPLEYDVFLFLRPDLEYLDRLQPELIFNLILKQEVDLVTATWHQWGGLNDRFAFCSRKGAEAYATRIDSVQRFCLEKGHLNAEELLARIASWSNLKLRYTNLRAMRIRADGATLREGFNLPPHVFVRGVVRKRLANAERFLARS